MEPINVEPAPVFEAPMRAFSFVMENPGPQQSPVLPEAPAVDEPAGSQPPSLEQQSETTVVEATQQPSELSQELYGEGMGRRVQPARARRTDFGKHTADEVIIEAIEREEREKPLISPDTWFFCTTKTSLMPNMVEILDSIHPAGTGQSLDELPMHSYFRDPDIMRKIRSQEVIETPTWREATTADYEEALRHIPEEFRGTEPDVSMDYYRRTQVKLERMEATARNREQSKLAHDYHHLKSRLSELEQLEPNGFRGANLVEQEKDKALVLSAAKKLLKNQRIKGRMVDEDEDEYGEYPNQGSTEGAKAIHNSIKGSTSKGTSTRRKKGESQFVYHPYDYDPDGELLEIEKKKKRSAAQRKNAAKHAAAAKKRKREALALAAGEGAADSEMAIEPDVEDREFHEPILKSEPMPKRLKTTASAFHKPVYSIAREKNVKKSMLLEQARKYNPGRVPRDIVPFGVAAVVLKSIDFELPAWILGDDVEGEESGGDSLRDQDMEDIDAQYEYGREYLAGHELQSSDLTPLEASSGPVQASDQAMDDGDSSLSEIDSDQDNPPPRETAYGGEEEVGYAFTSHEGESLAPNEYEEEEIDGELDDQETDEEYGAKPPKKKRAKHYGSKPLKGR